MLDSCDHNEFIVVFDSIRKCPICDGDYKLTDEVDEERYSTGYDAGYIDGQKIST